MRYGWLFRLSAFWIGFHYAPNNKRLCINFVPFVTLWIAFPGGLVPQEARAWNKPRELWHG